MEKITVDGKEFIVRGDPKVGTIRYIEEMEIEMMRKYLDDETILEMQDAEMDEMGDVLGELDVDELKNMMWERSTQDTLKTICLGTDEKLTVSELENMRASDLKELLESSEEALGGSAEDFTEDLGIGISSRTKELREQMMDGKNNSGENLPPAVSEISSEQ